MVNEDTELTIEDLKIHVFDIGERVHLNHFYVGLTTFKDVVQIVDAVCAAKSITKCKELLLEFAKQHDPKNTRYTYKITPVLHVSED